MQADILPLPICEWEGVHVRTLNRAERSALVDLLVAAWRSGDCTIPANPAELATLSNLGERWYGCRLQARLERWFEPGPEGRLLCTLLAVPHQARRRWVEKSRQGGRRSGQVRAAAAAASSNHPSTTLPAAPRRVVEPPLNHPSRPLSIQAATPVVATTSLVDTPRAVIERRQLPPDEPPLGGGSLGVGPDDTLDVSAELDSDLGPETVVFDQTEGSGAAAHPPTPPLCGDEFLEVNINTGGGGPGAGARRREKRPSSTFDLFGKRVRGPRMSEEDIERVQGLLGFYLAQVQPSRCHPGREGVRAVYELLSRGLSVEQLETAIMTYARELERRNTDPEYRKVAKNFFRWDNIAKYLARPKPAPEAAGAAQAAQETPAPPRPGASPYEGFALRVAAKAGPSCPSWFPLWAEELAKRFSFNKPGDADELATWWDLLAGDGITEAEARWGMQAAMRTPAFTDRAKPLSRAQFRSLLYSLIHRERTTQGRQVKDLTPRAEIGTRGEEWIQSPARRQLVERGFLKE